MADSDAKLKQSLREKATKDLEIWYEQRKMLIEKQKSKNRAAETNETEQWNSSPSEPVKYALISE